MLGVSTPEDGAPHPEGEVPPEYLEPTTYDSYEPRAPGPEPEADLGAAPAAPDPRVPPVHYGPPTPQVPVGASRVPSAAKLVVPLVVVVVLAVVVVGGVVALIGNKVQDAVEDSVPGIPATAPDADVLSVEGYQDLLDAVEAESGSTTAFSAVLYPTYAVVELPVDETTAHEEYWYWNGQELTANDIKSSSTSERTDLADLDPQVVVDLVRKVRRKMPDETSWYAVVRAPDDAGAVVWAYASNDYHDSVYLAARPDGTVTWDSTEH